MYHVELKLEPSSGRRLALTREAATEKHDRRCVERRRDGIGVWVAEWRDREQG